MLNTIEFLIHITQEQKTIRAKNFCHRQQQRGQRKLKTKDEKKRKKKESIDKINQIQKKAKPPENVLPKKTKKKKRKKTKVKVEIKTKNQTPKKRET